LKSSIHDICLEFRNKFKNSDINLYHVLKSLTYFEGAECEPLPILLLSGDDWQWEKVKQFFTKNIREFEKELLT